MGNSKSYRTIGILGASFCGSTAFSAALDCLPGVAAGGELHWSVDDERGRVRCGRCGEACPVFDPGFFERATVENAYDLAAQQLGVGAGGVLVSSDKWPGAYNRFAPAGLDLALVLWKDPEAAVASFMKYDPAQTWQGGTQLWVDFYGGVLAWAETREYPVVQVNHRRFMRDVDLGLWQLCRLVPWLEYGPAHPLAEIEYHALGGNLSAARRRQGFVADGPPKFPSAEAVRQALGVEETWLRLDGLPGLP